MGRSRDGRHAQGGQVRSDQRASDRRSGGEATRQARDCGICGATRTPGLLTCRYCRTSFQPGVQGIRCSACGDFNDPSRAACAGCGASLAIGCLFCGWASPLGSAGCRRCGEAFAGAEARKRERDAARERAQWTQVASQGVAVVGSVVATNPGLVSSVFDALGGIASAFSED